MNVSPQTGGRITRRIQMQGLVQGQGVRPGVARLALEHQVGGSVRNCARGVEINATGESANIEAFHHALQEQFNADVFVLSSEHTNSHLGEFQILPSAACTKLQTIVPTDLAICDQCIADIRSPDSRRFRYPFTSCTNCGPRYSIIREMPFDRSRTTMDSFPMCRECENEYRDPFDRRFHAQTNACPRCGPTCWSVVDGETTASGLDAIMETVKAIRCGKIAAIKGLGGYQLVCDASSDASVRRLRNRKRRPTKPLPIMVGDIGTAKTLAEIDTLEEQTLRGKINPIVLVRSRFHSLLSDSVHPNLADIGIMLPTTPLHWLLVELIGRPIVVTSGNLHGSPIAFTVEQATCDLAAVADVSLHHDRAIERPIDDSVVRCVAGNRLTIRAGRGIAPLAVCSNLAAGTLAVGGHQKVAPAISTDDHLILAPYIGDMNAEASRLRFEQSTSSIAQLYGLTPLRLACDLHPDYFTTDWAIRNVSSAAKVQHHHAHVAAAMLDHGLQNQTVLGFAFDGTGYGTDASIWGGEVLLATTSEFKRVAHLRPFTLPGGETAVKHPSRTALALIQQACPADVLEQWLISFDFVSDSETMRFAIREGTPTTSAGRMFDAVAAMVLPEFAVHYEGEPAMMLEAACDRQEMSAYEFEFEENETLVLDWRHLIRQVVLDQASLSPGRIAMKFHRAIASAVVELSHRFCDYPVVLTGGVFQNRVLAELIQEQARAVGTTFYFPGRIPINDGGLAIGQLIVASSQTGPSVRQSTGEGARSCV